MVRDKEGGSTATAGLCYAVLIALVAGAVVSAMLPWYRGPSPELSSPLLPQSSFVSLPINLYRNYTDFTVTDDGGVVYSGDQAVPYSISVVLSGQICKSRRGSVLILVNDSSPHYCWYTNPARRCRHDTCGAHCEVELHANDRVHAFLADFDDARMQTASAYFLPLADGMYEKLAVSSEPEFFYKVGADLETILEPVSGNYTSFRNATLCYSGNETRNVTISAMLVGETLAPLPGSLGIVVISEPARQFGGHDVSGAAPTNIRALLPYPSASPLPENVWATRFSEVVTMEPGSCVEVWGRMLQSHYIHHLCIRACSAHEPACAQLCSRVHTSLCA